MCKRKNGLIPLLSTLLLSTVLVACDNDTKIETTEIPLPPETSIILSADGVGPINATTSFNMHQMTVAFNEFSVVEELTYVEGTPLPAIRISQGVNTIIKMIPDASQQNIYSVIIEDNIVKNSLGHPLGTLYNVVYPYGQNELCQAGDTDFSGKVLCYAPKNPNILYVFNGTSGNVSVGKKPSADILQGWALESIIWRPKS